MAVTDVKIIAKWNSKDTTASANRDGLTPIGNRKAHRMME